MKRKIIIIPVIVFAVLIALFIGKNTIIKTSVSAGVKAMTGLKLSIGSMNVGVFKSLLGIHALRLHNPEGFEDELMLDVPEIYVDYDMGSFMKGKAHLEEVRLNLRELLVEKNADGQLNLDSLRVVKETEKEGAEEDKGQKEKAEMPDIQVDLLALRIDRVIYKDYSKEGSPRVKEFNVNIDERYEDITDPRSLVRLIIIKALKNTTIARLANFDIGKLQKALTETAREAAAKALETPDMAVEAGKKTAVETVEKVAEAGKEADEKIKKAAQETVNKAADTIRKILPFGNKERK